MLRDLTNERVAKTPLLAPRAGFAECRGSPPQSALFDVGRPDSLARLLFRELLREKISLGDEPAGESAVQRLAASNAVEWISC